MKIAIYSPYLDTAGGGEKYILTIAETLSQTAQVDVLLDTHLAEIGKDAINLKVNNLHNLDLSKVNFIKAPVGKGANFFHKLQFLKTYDWLFYLTDGSIFFSTAKNSVLHFQVPFTQSPSGVWGKIKLNTWKEAIFNSEFTKKFVEESWKIKGEVVYPPVSVEKFKPLPKKKQIVSVGRFFGFLKDKKHQFLIESFKELVKDNKLNNWSLHLAGGVGVGDDDYLAELKEMAKGINVHFYPNASLTQVAKLYGESEIYWHASGFGETDPKRFEHFGITVVEAMASGCVPVVINKGGLKEIIQNEKSGLLWDSPTQLFDMTIKVVKDSKMREQLAKEAIIRSKDFSKQKFEQKINNLIYGK